MSPRHPSEIEPSKESIVDKLNRRLAEQKQPYKPGERQCYPTITQGGEPQVTPGSAEELTRSQATANAVAEGLKLAVMKPTNPKDAVGIRKPRFYSGVSGHVRRLVSIGMMEGAMKYGRHNYRPSAVRASVYYDATGDHIDSWWEGEDIDPDSKLNHVIKAICSLYVLADAIVTGNLVDDRPPRTRNVSEFKAELQPLIDALFEKYPEPKEAFTAANAPNVKGSTEK